MGTHDMNLYLIYTVSGRTKQECRIIRATSEMQARQLAALHDDDWGMRRWLDMTMSLCSQIPVDGPVGVVTAIGMHNPMDANVMPMAAE